MGSIQRSCSDNYGTFIHYFGSSALVGLGLLIFEASRSHSSRRGLHTATLHASH